MKYHDRFFPRTQTGPRTRKRTTALLLILLLLPLPPFSLASFAEGKASLTLLVYMTGSDLETNGKAASKDILEMTEALPAGSGIRVLLQAGGAESWDLAIDPEKSTRIEIRNGQWQTAETGEDRNMAESDTLRDFLQWGYAYAPANRYALIIWNHGAGPLVGVCLDERHPDPVTGMDSLTMSELEEALAGSPFREEKLLFIGFDACMMCTMEVASLVTPFAEYMIASQDIEPKEGWAYGFLREMTGREDGDAWGERIVADYLESQKDTMNSATLSCLDLSRMGVVLTELEAFFDDLKDRITRETYSDYTRCRERTKSFGSLTTSGYDLIDLIHLIERYEAKGLADGTALRAAVGDMIVAQCAHESDHTNGLSIYYPFDNKAGYIASWSSEYQKSSFSTAYRAFIGRVSDYYLQDSLFSTASEYQTDLQEEVGSVRVRLSLMEEDASRFVKARMLVLEKLATDAYRLVYYNDQDIDATSTAVSCRYSGEALFVVNEAGEILQGPLSYFPVENGVAVYGFLYFGETYYVARVVFQKNKEGRLVMTQVMTPQGNGKKQVFLPSSLDPAASTEMMIVAMGPANEGEDTLTSLDFDVYFPEYVCRVNFNDPDQKVGLALVPGWSRNDRYAYIRLTDVQNETVCSIPVLIPSYAHLTVAHSRELAPGAGLTAFLIGGTLVTGGDAGIMFKLAIRNVTDIALELQVSNVSLNSNVYLDPSQFEAFQFSLVSGEEDEITVFIPIETLRSMQLPEEITGVSLLFIVSDSLQNSREYKVSFPMAMDASVLQEGL